MNNHIKIHNNFFIMNIILIDIKKKQFKYLLQIGLLNHSSHLNTSNILFLFAYKN